MRTIFPTVLNAGSTRVYHAELETRAGAALPAVDVSTITATLTTLSGTVINSRSAQNVKNINGGTLTDGIFELVLSAADTALSGTDRLQARRLLLTFTTADGVEVHTVIFTVQDPTS